MFRSMCTMSSLKRFTFAISSADELLVNNRMQSVRRARIGMIEPQHPQLQCRAQWLQGRERVKCKTFS